MAKEANRGPSLWDLYLDARSATLKDLDDTYGNDGALERMNSLLQGFRGLSVADIAVGLSTVMIAAADAEKCMAVGPDDQIIEGSLLAKNPQYVAMVELLMTLVCAAEGSARILDANSDDVPDSVKNRRALISEVNSIGN